MSCTKTGYDAQNTLNFRTRSALIQSGGVETEHCTILKGDDARHVIEVTRQRKYYKKVTVKGVIQRSGSLVLHATFLVAGTSGQTDWTDTNSLPHKFTDVAIEHQQSGQEKIRAEVYAHSRWSPTNGHDFSNRVDQNDLEFTITSA